MNCQYNILYNGEQAQWVLKLEFKLVYVGGATISSNSLYCLYFKVKVLLIQFKINFESLIRRLGYSSNAA